MSQKPRQVAEFEDLINNSVQKFVDASTAIGEPLISLAAKVKRGFEQNLLLIQYGLNNPQPSADNELMVNYSNVIRDIVETRESVKDSTFANHFSTIREAILALGWINIKPAPVQYIKDMTDCGMFYANRVLLNNKGNPLHINWVTSWNSLLMDLQQYVKATFLTGMTWASNKNRGGDMIPPPPPPPPPGFADLPAAGDGARQALLNDLNQGSSITQSLRPVKRNGPAAPPVSHGKVPTTAGVARTVAAPVHPPKFLLEGRKWVVENQKSNYGMRVDNDDMAQTLAMYRCEDSSLEVLNKINSVTIDSCKRTSVVLKDVISSVDIIRGTNVKIQADGRIPLINLDNCDSVQIFLTAVARGVEIISSKSTSCNVCLLESDGDYKEVAMPEQIKSVLQGGKLVSTVLEKN